MPGLNIRKKKKRDDPRGAPGYINASSYGKSLKNQPQTDTCIGSYLEWSYSTIKHPTYTLFVIRDINTATVDLSLAPVYLATSRL